MMLGWVFKPKARATKTAGQQPAGGAEGDLEYLRGQADFDAEQMATVHRASDKAPQSPTGTRAVGTEYPATARLSGRSEASQPGNRRATTGAKPQPSTAGGVGELVLSVNVGTRSSVITLQEVALIGRYDDEQDLTPEIDLSADDAVSRRHARIFRRGGQFWLRDLDSTNGTRLNQQWLEPELEFPLSPGDVIELGEVSALRILDISFGVELTAEDEELAGLLDEALGISLATDETAWPVVPPPGVRAEEGLDLLAVALTRSAEAGLIPSDAAEDLPPVPASQWRLQELEDFELPSFVEPYR